MYQDHILFIYRSGTGFFSANVDLLSCIFFFHLCMFIFSSFFQVCIICTGFFLHVGLLYGIRLWLKYVKLPTPSGLERRSVRGGTCREEHKTHQEFAGGGRRERLCVPVFQWHWEPGNTLTKTKETIWSLFTRTSLCCYITGPVHLWVFKHTHTCCNF